MQRNDVALRNWARDSAFQARLCTSFLPWGWCLQCSLLLIVMRKEQTQRDKYILDHHRKTTLKVWPCHPCTGAMMPLQFVRLGEVLVLMGEAARHSSRDAISSWLTKMFHTWNYIVFISWQAMWWRTLCGYGDDGARTRPKHILLRGDTRCAWAFTLLNNTGKQHEAADFIKAIAMESHNLLETNARISAKQPVFGILC